ncbi:MAG: alkaline phosphatase D family protein [Pseudomonadota bacterium]|nr:alkaline phosphatase D family protein [Pseudomonadota bacterium]
MRLFKNFFIVCLFQQQLYSNEIILGLGSCLDQEYPQPIWQSIKEEDLNYFVFLGDNVYGDSPDGNLDKLVLAYKKQKELLPTWLKPEMIFSIWDDHDFGLNDGGGSFVNKSESEKIYLDFWGVSNTDPRRNRDGIYYSKKLKLSDKTIKLIFLDTRFFRSDLKKKNEVYQANNENNSTILGEDQWIWLKKQFQPSIDAYIIFSSIQILATEHRFEKWSNFPTERSKLIDFLKKQQVPKMLVSGDRHRGGIYKYNDSILEITSSSLNKPGSGFSEFDPLLIGNTHNEENYGILRIGKNTIKVELKNIEGVILEKAELIF